MQPNVSQLHISTAQVTVSSPRTPRATNLISRAIRMSLDFSGHIDSTPLLMQPFQRHHCAAISAAQFMATQSSRAYLLRETDLDSQMPWSHACTHTVVQCEARSGPVLPIKPVCPSPRDLDRVKRPRAGKEFDRHSRATSGAPGFVQFVHGTFEIADFK